MSDFHLEFDTPATRCITCGGRLEPWKAKTAHGHRFTYDRCTRCDHVIVNPRPTLASLGLYYRRYDEVSDMPKANVDATRPPVAGPDQRRLLHRMLSFRPGPGTFLDVGSGSGIATAAARDVGLTVTALEVQPSFVASTRLLPGVRVQPLLFEQFEDEPGAYDYVLMSHVLEHVHDPLGFMRKAARLLSPGGLICILLPNFDSIYRRLLGTGDPYFIPPGHLNHFNPNALSVLCRRVGLSVAECADYHDVPRDVVSKRLPRIVRPAIEGATAVGAALACWGTGLVGCGAFVSCFARKPRRA